MTNHTHLTVHRGNGSFLQVSGYSSSKEDRYQQLLQNSREEALSMSSDLQLTMVQERSPDYSIVGAPGGGSHTLSCNGLTITVPQGAAMVQLEDSGDGWSRVSYYVKTD